MAKKLRDPTSRIFISPDPCFGSCSESESIPQKMKNNFISTVMRLPYDFLPLNVSSKENKHKNLEEKNILCWRLTSLTKKGRTWIRIRESGSEDPHLHPDPYQNVTHPQHCLIGYIWPLKKILPKCHSFCK
jgi:hypothetical protein